MIESQYDVIGYCDTDENKVAQFVRGLTRSQLQSTPMDTYDKIVIVPTNPLDIARDLVNNLNIPINKIEVFVAEDRRRGEVDLELPVYTFHGGYNDDAILALLIYQLRIKISDIKYLEIGTNHPVNGNQTYVFYRRGAHGVLVEPLLHKFDMLMHLFRPNDTAIAVAVTGVSSDKTTTFYEAENLLCSDLCQVPF